MTDTTQTQLPKTLTEAVIYFAEWEKCRDYLVAHRWPNGITCPVCGAGNPYFDKSRKGWECRTRHPKRKFTLKTGTIFEDSALGFDKWLPTVWLIANCKNGVSSHEIARAVGVTQKTAWFMLHRVRLAMQDGDEGGMLGGDVEVDESFIGGKARNMHKDKRREKIHGRGGIGSGKVAVMGLLERHSTKGHSQVRAKVVPNTRKRQLQPEVFDLVLSGSTVYTDELKSYDGLSKDYTHNVIKHAECYAEGQVHVNGMENFWSLLKRGLHGTYVSVEPFHLFRYLDEQVFRFNNPEGDRRLTYASLTGLAVGEHLN